MVKGMLGWNRHRSSDIFFGGAGVAFKDLLDLLLVIHDISISRVGNEVVSISKEGGLKCLKY